MSDNKFNYEDFTYSQLLQLRGSKGDSGEKGDKGDPLRFEDLTDAQKEELRGLVGVGLQGPQGIKGDAGYTPQHGVDYFDGKAGKFVSYIYTTQTSVPLPIDITEGSFDGTNEIIPNGWEDDPVGPVSDEEFVYMSKTVYSVDDQGVWTKSGWSTPIKFSGENGFTPVKGTDYLDGLNGRYFSYIYKISETIPNDPSGGSFNPDNNPDEVIPSTWRDDPIVPGPGERLYMSSTVYTYNTATDEWEHNGWSAPKVFTAKDGIDGIDGESGESPILGVLTNEVHNVPASSDGILVAGALNNAGGTFNVFYGLTNVNSLATYSAVNPVGLTASIGTNGVYTIDSLIADTGTVTFRAEYLGITLDKTYTITKSKVGANGTAATLSLSANGQIFTYDTEGKVSAPDSITISAVAVNLDGETITWSSNPVGFITGTGSSVNITKEAFDALGAPFASITATVDTGEFTIYDTYTLVRVNDGTRGSKRFFHEVNNSTWVGGAGDVAEFASIVDSYIALTDVKQPRDVVTLTNIGQDPIITETRYWDNTGAGEWALVTEYVDGNLVVDGSIAAKKIDVADLFSKNASVTGKLTVGVESAGYVSIGSGEETSDILLSAQNAGESLLKITKSGEVAFGNGVVISGNDTIKSGSVISKEVWDAKVPTFNSSESTGGLVETTTKTEFVGTKTLTIPKANTNLATVVCNVSGIKVYTDQTDPNQAPKNYVISLKDKDNNVLATKTITPDVAIEILDRPFGSEATFETTVSLFHEVVFSDITPVILAEAFEVRLTIAASTGTLGIDTIYLDSFSLSQSLETQAVEVIVNTDWSDLTGKPSSFPPSTHSHSIANVTGLQTALDGKLAAGGKATDSDKLDGKNFDWFLQAGNDRLTDDASTINYDCIRPWDVSTATDAPSGALDGLLTTLMWDSAPWGVQQYHDFHNNNLYLKSLQNGTWQSDWTKVWSDANFSLSAAGVLEDAHTWTGVQTFSGGYDFNGSERVRAQTWSKTWDNWVTEHYLLKNGWTSNSGDYLMLQGGGNQTVDRTLLISDTLGFQFGTHDAGKTPVATTGLDTPLFSVSNSGVISTAHTWTATQTFSGAGYGINVNTDIDMNNHVIHFTRLLHFNSGVKLQNQASNSIWHKSGSTSSGMIDFRDSADARKGVVFWDAAGFGLLDKDGSWAFRADGTDATLHRDGSARFGTTSTGVRIIGTNTGNPNYAYLSFAQSDGTRDGYVGVGSGSNRNVYLVADSGEVNFNGTYGIRFQYGGSTKLFTDSAGTQSYGNLEVGATSTGYAAAALEVREVNRVTTGQSSSAYAPAITFHWGGRYQNALAMASNGQWYFWDGDNYAVDNTVNSYIFNATGSLQENGINIAESYLKMSDLSYGSNKTYSVAETVIGQFQQDYDNGLFSDYSAGYASVAAGFVDAVMGQFNLLVSDKANVNYLSARNIEVTGRRALVNNFSATGHTDGWTLGIGTLTDGVIQKDGHGVKALELTTNGNAVIYSQQIEEVNHDAIYEVTCSYFCANGTGRRIFAMRARNSSSAEISVERYSPDHTLAGTGVYPNLSNKSDAGVWITVKSYIVGANVDVSAVPNVEADCFVKLPIETVKFNLLLQNWDNAGIETTSAYFYNVSAREIGAGLIVADNIKVTDLEAIGATIGGWNINSTHIYHGGTTNAGLFASAGHFFLKGDGEIRSENFAIHSDGNAYFRGDLSAASGAIGSGLNTLRLAPDSNYALWYGNRNQTVNDTNAVFYLDSDGNAAFKGDISGASGTFEGALSGNTITGATITGTLQSATSGQRVKIDATVQRFYDSSGNNTATLGGITNELSLFGSTSYAGLRVSSSLADISLFSNGSNNTTGLSSDKPIIVESSNSSDYIELRNNTIIKESSASPADLDIRNTEGGLTLRADGDRAYLYHTSSTGTQEDIAIQSQSNSSVWICYNNLARVTTTNGGITVTGTGTATDWSATSDKRVKYDDALITNARHTLRQIPARTFMRKDGDDLRYAGSFAQDWLRVFPEAVRFMDDSEGESGLDQKLTVLPQSQIGLIMGATVEIDDEVITLRKEIVDIKAELSKLKKNLGVLH